MKVDTSLRTVEPLAMVKKHPVAATVGGVASAIALGVFSAFMGGPIAGLVMAALGAVIGAPGGAHLADAAEPQPPA